MLSLWLNTIRGAPSRPYQKYPNGSKPAKDRMIKATEPKVAPKIEPRDM
jgi:hypothetical protein